MEGIDVPSYFLCPISLEIMRDPVTLSTGITYDRASIERWIFTEKHDTCPATKQPLTDTELTPNHTLRRLVQAWCAANASSGVERFPTPKPPVDKAHVALILDEVRLPECRTAALRRLKDIVSESERNKRCVEAAGAADVLLSIISDDDDDRESTTNAGDEALSILYYLQLSEQGLLALIAKNESLIESLTKILRRANYQSRAYATLLLKSIVAVAAPSRLMSLSEELFHEIVSVVRDGVSQQATKAALKVLAGVCLWGRNRIKAVEAGAVAVLVEQLLDEPERRACEAVLAVLEQLCRCAEGRAAVVAHAAGITVVSKKMLRVSPAATERAVRVLHWVCKCSPTPAVAREMLNVGAVTKLCLMLQVDCGAKSREKALEILRLHARTWKDSPCMSPQFLASLIAS